MGVLLFADFKATVSTLNCVIEMNGQEYAGGVDTQIEVEDTSVTVTIQEKTTVFEFPNLELSPPSCRSLRYTAQGVLQFSLEARKLEKQSRKSVGTETAVNQSTDAAARMSCQAENVKTIETFQNRVFCKMCGEKLFPDSSVFTRVLPLPSAGWSEGTDIWFCHQHDESTVKFSEMFNPKVHECFVGDTCILVNSSDLRSGAVTVTTSGVIRCSRCRRQLGGDMNRSVSGTGVTSHGQQSSTYRLHLHTLRFTDPCLEEGPEALDIKRYKDTTEQFFARFLQEQSKAYTSFRFIIDSPTPRGGHSYCLIWLLEQSGYLYRSRSGRDPEHPAVDCDRVLKLLYRPKLSDPIQSVDCAPDPVVQMWKKDNTVHSLTLPHPVFLHFLRHLVDSTTSLPQTQRYLGGFHMGFLHHGS